MVSVRGTLLLISESHFGLIPTQAAGLHIQDRFNIVTI